MFLDKNFLCLTWVQTSYIECSLDSLILSVAEIILTKAVQGPAGFCQGSLEGQDR